MKKPWQDIIHHHTYELAFSRRDNDAAVPDEPHASSLPIKDLTHKRMVDDLPSVLNGPIRVTATRNYVDDHTSTIEVRVAGSDQPVVGNYVVTESTHGSDHLIVIMINKVSDKGGVQEINYVPWTEIRSVSFHRQCFKH